MRRIAKYAVSFLIIIVTIACTGCTATGDIDVSVLEESSYCYNKDIALLTAKLSEAAESGQSDIESLYAEYGIGNCESYNYKGASTILSLKGSAFNIGYSIAPVNNEETAILVITARGSTTLGEFIGDVFKGGTRNFNGQSVFHNVYEFEENIWKALDKYVGKHKDLKDAKKMKIIICGHSLGGAAANMVGARMNHCIDSGDWWSQRATKEDVYTYTFGAIKVLDTDENISDGNENIHNIYNYYDSFGPNGNQKKYNASSPNAKFGHTDLYISDSHRDKEEGADFTGTCNNHLMANYIAAIEDEVILYDKMESELYDFISNMVYYYDRTDDRNNQNGYGGDYNYETATENGILMAIMWNCPCVNFGIYPGQTVREEPYKNDIPDPMGLAVDDGYVRMYYKYHADTINWIAKNIFNVSDESIKEQVEAATQNAKSVTQDSIYAHNKLFYESDGYYYAITSGMGWESTYDFSIDNVEREGDDYLIRYIQNEYNYRGMEGDVLVGSKQFEVKMQYKEIDGKKYWTLFSRTEV